MRPVPALPFSLALLLAVCCLAGPSQAQDRTEVPWDDTLPPGTPAHVTRALAESSRHGEWVDIAMTGGSPLTCWVVWPERPDPAGVVLVIHDIRGMSEWIRAVGDQLAQDGFVAIVPDFLSGKGKDGGGTAALGNDVGPTIRKLSGDEVVARLDVAMDYGKKLPAANGRTAVLGFCWGGTQSFGYALAQAQLAAAVVYYGSLPGATADGAPADRIAAITAPVLGLYGGDDARVNATLPPTQVAMRAQQKVFEPHTFLGAGHGFLHRQDGADGKNLAAARGAWPLTVAFLRRHLEGGAAATPSPPTAPASADAKVRELLQLLGVGTTAVAEVRARFERVEGVPDAFHSALQKRARPEAIVDLLVPVYRRQLDDEAIDAALAFYRTAAGKKWLLAWPLLQAEARETERTWGEQLADEVMRELGR